MLIENLQTVEKLKSDELFQVVDGLMIDKQISKETERMNEKINCAVERFMKTKDVDTFLDNVTFNDDLADFFVHDFEEADIIFKTNCISVLLYGCETWKVTNSIQFVYLTSG